MKAGSEEYEILRRWIADGVVAPAPDDPFVKRIALSPRQKVLGSNASEALHVTAHFSDGTSRDVTGQSIYESNEPEIASVESNGLVKTRDRTGLFSVMVRFGGRIATFHAVVPSRTSDQQRGEIVATMSQLEQQQTSPFGRLLIRQWKRPGITPSEPAD